MVFLVCRVFVDNTCILVVYCSCLLRGTRNIYLTPLLWLIEMHLWLSSGWMSLNLSFDSSTATSFIAHLTRDYPCCYIKKSQNDWACSLSCIIALLPAVAYACTYKKLSSGISPHARFLKSTITLFSARQAKMRMCFPKSQLTRPSYFTISSLLGYQCW